MYRLVGLIGGLCVGVAFGLGYTHYGVLCRMRLLPPSPTSTSALRSWCQRAAGKFPDTRYGLPDH